ncbi:MAG: carbamoyltransferase HypF [Anaerolineaceae bacterium]|nr:carbamoyltransferase HypF [Anaerolineaceae bacterium]
MPEVKALKIHIKGIVQGVGFRPFVYSLAIQNNLNGWVQNTSSGVDIELVGSTPDLEVFISALKNSPPHLSRIDSISIDETEKQSYKKFEIIKSQSQAGEFIPISPDYSICDDCLRELFDPQDRRFRYPFINCTNCGPRFSIIKDIPYDRPKTTMAPFQMCDRCQSEYSNPLDRRYHAQPIACPDCGPQVSLMVNNQIIAKGNDAIQQSRKMVRTGKILATKGLGGFHLACDAGNHSAVENLRTRKKRSDKPFALMAFSISLIENYCSLSGEEKKLLESKEKPIVLLKLKSTNELSPLLAPAQKHLGFLLPYTPLHYLLLDPVDENPEVWVMTSGNLSEEPIAYKDSESINQLSNIADGFLMHDREIFMRVDDSVTRIVQGKNYPIRRSRGYAPNPIITPSNVPQILATGAELKNTFCLTRDNYAFISHHIGDLENYETLISFEEAINHYENLFRIKPSILASDLHPDYLATRYATQRANLESIPNIQIQHHHAHLASCLADNHWKVDDFVIGLCYDGTGFGTDGAIWGGEVLIGNYSQYQRRFHLKYVPLPGGDITVRIPARMALSHLWEYQLDWDYSIPSVASLCMEDRTVLESQLKSKINTPNTSSMGRLFDAAASIMGIKHRVNYEGQAAIEMEALIDEKESKFYPIEIENNLINPKPLFESLIIDQQNNVSINKMAARFHNSIVQYSTNICIIIRKESGINSVALSGGVWQNKVLLDNTIKKLKKERFDVMIHHNVPTNDGGISLGQALIASKFTIK